MSTAGEGDERSSIARSELFEALSHPIRVRILESLESASLGFSDLKKATGVQSNGHLEFHLRKLAGLVSTGGDGNYGLTDLGREALRFLRLESNDALHVRMPPRALNVEKVAITAVIVVLLVIGFALIPTGLVLNSQTAWRWSGSSDCCVWTNSTGTVHVIPGGGSFWAGWGNEFSSDLTSRVVATWTTVNATGDLVFSVLDVPQGTSLAGYGQSETPVNQTLVVASTTGSAADFAYLTYTLHAGSDGTSFVLTNPSSAPVTLTSLSITRETEYNPYGATGWYLTYVGITLIAVAIVSIGVISIRPQMIRTSGHQLEQGTQVSHYAHAFEPPSGFARRSR